MESLGILNVTDNKKNVYCIDGNDALEIKLGKASNISEAVHLQKHEFCNSKISKSYCFLVRNPEDLQSPRFSFKPDMCHQVFGER